MNFLDKIKARILNKKDDKLKIENDPKFSTVPTEIMQEWVTVRDDQLAKLNGDLKHYSNIDSNKAAQIQDSINSFDKDFKDTWKFYISNGITPGVAQSWLNSKREENDISADLDSKWEKYMLAEIHPRRAQEWENFKQELKEAVIKREGALSDNFDEKFEKKWGIHVKNDHSVGYATSIEYANFFDPEINFPKWSDDAERNERIFNKIAKEYAPPTPKNDITFNDVSAEKLNEKIKLQKQTSTAYDVIEVDEPKPL